MLEGSCKRVHDFRGFIPNFTNVVKPFSPLIKKNFLRNGGDPQQAAFGGLKTLLITAHILREFDQSISYVIRTDTSSYFRKCLLQGESNNERPVEYFSCLLTQSTTETEALALVYAVNMFRMYIERCPVCVATDHNIWLIGIKSQSSQLVRCAFELQAFDLKKTTPGCCNLIVDTLLRPTMIWRKGFVISAALPFSYSPSNPRRYVKDV